MKRRDAAPTRTTDEILPVLTHRLMNCGEFGSRLELGKQNKNISLFLCSYRIIGGGTDVMWGIEDTPASLTRALCLLEEELKTVEWYQDGALPEDQEGAELPSEKYFDETFPCLAWFVLHRNCQQLVIGR